MTRSGLTQRTKNFVIRSRRRRNRYTEIYFDVVAPCGLSFLVSLPHQIGPSATGRGAPAVDNELIRPVRSKFKRGRTMAARGFTRTAIGRSQGFHLSTSHSPSTARTEPISTMIRSSVSVMA